MTKRIVAAFGAAVLGLSAAFVPVALAEAAPTATVPVKVCPTVLGVKQNQKPVPSSAQVPAAAANLVLYSATSSYVQVLGPKGLSCHAIIGADGTGTINARQTASPGGQTGTAGKATVAAVADPTCTACLLTLACPYFPAALKTARADHYNCPARPPGEVTSRLGADVVAFTAPAHTKLPAGSAGPAPPRTSPYPTKGVVIYGTYLFGGHRNSTAMEAVCVLPASEQSVCKVVLNEFLATQVKKFLP